MPPSTKQTEDMKSKITIEGLDGTDNLGLVIDLLYTLRHGILRDEQAYLKGMVTFDLDKLCFEMFHHAPSDKERELVSGLCHSLNVRISREDKKSIIGDNVASMAEIVQYRLANGVSGTDVTMLIGRTLTSPLPIDELMDNAKMYLESALTK